MTWWLPILAAWQFIRAQLFPAFSRFSPLFPAFPRISPPASESENENQLRNSPNSFYYCSVIFRFFFGFRFSVFSFADFFFFPCTRRLMTLFCFSFNWSRTFYLLFHSFHSLSFPPPLCFPSLSFRGAIIGSLGIVACLHGFRYPNVIPHVNLARFVQFVQPAGCQSAAPSISPSICQSMQFTDKVIEPFGVEELHDLRSWR